MLAKTPRKSKAPVKKKKTAAPAKKALAKKKASAPKKSAAKTPKKATASKIQPLDLSAFPPESVNAFEKWICLACVLDVFTHHLGMSAKSAWLEIRQYHPPAAELHLPETTRPYFTADPPDAKCPYCGSAKRWHARLPVFRIESGKATDAPRRALVKSLPKTKDAVLVLEEKATRQHAFFEWLEKTTAGFDLDNPIWLRDITRHYLSRLHPKEDWEVLLRDIHAIRRSRRLAEGWEIEAGRLFLAPMQFDEILLVQYLVSRSQKAGGLTLEGRYTLPELYARLRNSGYLRSIGVSAHNPSDALEELLAHLSGGETALKFYYIVDRREYLDRVKSLQA